jgi:hypothetical protein
MLPKQLGESLSEPREEEEENHEDEFKPEVRAALEKFSLEGLNLTPDMIEKLIPKFELSPIMNTLSDRNIDVLAVLVGENGKLFPAIQVTNPSFADTRMKPENPDFMQLWEQQHLKLSVNLTHGFLSFMTHGLEAQLKPYVTQILKPYDVEDLFCISAAYMILQRERHRTSGKPWKRGAIPQRMRFTKKIRGRIRKHYKLLRGIERERRRRECKEERIGHYSGHIYG